MTGWAASSAAICALILALALALDARGRLILLVSFVVGLLLGLVTHP